MTSLIEGTVNCNWGNYSKILTNIYMDSFFFYYLKHQLEVVGWKICLIFAFVLHEIVDIAGIFKISRVEKS